MTNCMKELANLLGVEDEEIFQVGNDSTLKNSFFRFSDGFLYMSNDIEDGSSWEIAADGILIGLIYGNLSIRKLLWKPKYGDEYYVPNIFVQDLWAYYSWNDDEYDKKLYERGVVCKTKEEAVVAAEKMLAAINEQ